MRRLALFFLLLALAVAAQQPAPPTYTKPELRAELLAMRDEDQAVRKRWLADRDNPHINDEMRTMNARHVARVQEILRDDGWPTVAMVGKDGSGAVWLILQHATPEVIKASLSLMTAAVDRGDLGGGL